MANYAYQAINASGANIRGTIHAESATLAENILTAQIPKDSMFPVTGLGLNQLDKCEHILQGHISFHVMRGRKNVTAGRTHF